MNESLQTADFYTAKTGRIAGIILAVTALLTIVAMGHHPTGHESPSAGLGMSLGGFIHATMIVLLTGTTWGLLIFSLGEPRSGWVIAALLAYAVSFFSHISAALINGFIVPSLAVELDPSGSSAVFEMLWQGNQAAAELGTYAASAAFALWSIHLLRRKPNPDLLLGIVGLLVAVGTSGALYSGVIALDVSGALIAYGGHAIWTGLVGVQLFRGAR
jgi:hypothetical protein